MPSKHLRTNVYIDGFNLHRRLLRPLGAQWLNAHLFFTKLRSDDFVQKIYYFTAELSGLEREGHLLYVHLLEKSHIDVEIVYGKHHEQPAECQVKICTFTGNRGFFLRKEKRTDVNIALRMAIDALRDGCDQQIVVSGDSDLIPAVKFCQDETKKKVVVYVPVTDDNKYQANELRDSVATGHCKNLPTHELKKAQFPEQVKDRNGNTIDRKTINW